MRKKVLIMLLIANSLLFSVAATILSLAVSPKWLFLLLGVPVGTAGIFALNAIAFLLGPITGRVGK